MQKIFEGNRGEIFLTTFKRKKAILKRFKNDNSFLQEYKALKFLEPFNIAPKLFDSGKSWVLMEYCEGDSLKEAWSKEALQKALLAAFKLDNLALYHRQLGRYYHFIFTKEGVKVIDFERSTFTKKPRNVLQFIGYYLRHLPTKEIVALYKKEPRRGIKALLEIIDV